MSVVDFNKTLLIEKNNKFAKDSNYKIKECIKRHKKTKKTI